jgi:hypothetical protein
MRRAYVRAMVNNGPCHTAAVQRLRSFEDVAQFDTILVEILVFPDCYTSTP